MSNSAGSPKLSASQRIFSPKRGLDAELIGADWSFQEMKENLALPEKSTHAGSGCEVHRRPPKNDHKGCIHVMTAKNDPDTAARITRLVW